VTTRSAPPRARPPRKRVRASPLRYPGGKGSLYLPLKRLLRANGLTGCTYVEPFAGGAGAALSLLLTGEVDRVVLNDLDPALYAFWRAASEHPEVMIERVEQVEITVDEWKKQRNAYLNAPRRDYLSLGFATFFLNRTNHSGILNGGPIGGLDQSGRYKIDARFNRSDLAERLRLIGLYSKSITVLRWDGAKVIDRYADRDDCFIYADPPYFEKAGTLYLNSFTADDHERLAATLRRHASSRWLLTYDNVPAVRDLYKGLRKATFPLHYSAHRVVRAEEIAVFSQGLARVGVTFEDG
jgi:DNA adenine methylase